MSKTSNDATLKRMEKLTDGLPLALEKSIQANIGIVVDKAKENAPVVTGELRRSIGKKPVDTGSKIVATADHATKVHEDQNSTGFKFMNRAVEETRDELVERITDDAKTEIKKNTK